MNLFLLQRLLLMLLVTAATLKAADGPSPQRRPGAPAQRREQAPAWLMPPVQGPNLQYKTFDSKAAGTNVSYLLYLPVAYEQAKAQRFPVVYWLHGIGGSQQGVPEITRRLTAAITEGKAPPMIFVFVNGMVDSFYCDASKVNRPVETVIIKELIPHIDATYRTVATREGRMIEGFSMGGFGAGHLGFKYPQLFGSVSMIDAALVDLNMMKGRHAEIFQRVFDGKEENYLAAHPLALAKQNVAQLKGKTLIRQAVGKLVQPNSLMHEQLTSLGLAHEYKTFEVGHSPGIIYERLGDGNWAFYAQAFVTLKTIGKSKP